MTVIKWAYSDALLLCALVLFPNVVLAQAMELPFLPTQVDEKLFWCRDQSNVKTADYKTSNTNYSTCAELIGEQVAMLYRFLIHYEDDGRAQQLVKDQEAWQKEPSRKSPHNHVRYWVQMMRLRELAQSVRELTSLKPELARYALATLCPGWTPVAPKNEAECKADFIGSASKVVAQAMELPFPPTQADETLFWCKTESNVKTSNYETTNQNYSSCADLIKQQIAMLYRFLIHYEDDGRAQQLVKDQEEWQKDHSRRSPYTRVRYRVRLKKLLSLETSVRELTSLKPQLARYAFATLCPGWTSVAPKNESECKTAYIGQVGKVVAQAKLGKKQSSTAVAACQQPPGQYYRPHRNYELFVLNQPLTLYEGISKDCPAVRLQSGTKIMRIAGYSRDPNYHLIPYHQKDWYKVAYMAANRLRYGWTPHRDTDGLHKVAEWHPLYRTLGEQEVHRVLALPKSGERYTVMRDANLFSSVSNPRRRWGVAPERTTLSGVVLASLPQWVLVSFKSTKGKNKYLWIARSVVMDDAQFESYAAAQLAKRKAYEEQVQKEQSIQNFSRWAVYIAVGLYTILILATERGRHFIDSAGYYYFSERTVAKNIFIVSAVIAGLLSYSYLHETSPEPEDYRWFVIWLFCALPFIVLIPFFIYIPFIYLKELTSPIWVRRQVDEYWYGTEDGRPDYDAINAAIKGRGNDRTRTYYGSKAQTRRVRAIKDLLRERADAYRAHIDAAKAEDEYRSQQRG